MWRGLGDAIASCPADATCAASSSAARASARSRPATTSANSRASARTRRRRASTARTMHATAHALDACPIPLVAQIHGICVGGGLEIAALCDLRICGASSRFGAPIKNLGLVMAYAGDGAARAARRARRRARDPARRPHLRRRRGEGQGARDARRRRRPRSRPKSRATAARIAEGAPLVARWHKKFVRRLADPRADLRRPKPTSASTASTPRTSASATPRSSRSASRSSRDDDAEPRAIGTWPTPHPGPLARHARARARADHGRDRRAACCSPTWAPT